MIMYGTGKCTRGCRNCKGDCDAGCACSCCRNNDSSKESAASVKISVKPPGSCYVMQILNCGINNDNFYETRLTLAPEIDVSSIKITVKNNNLRVTARRPLGELAGQLPEIFEKSALGDLVKRTIKHSENFLIPDNIDGEKVRAVMDNKQRILVLTAPFQKATKAWTKRNCNKCRGEL